MKIFGESLHEIQQTLKGINPNYITNVNLSSLKLTKIPDFIFELPNIQELSLENNQIEKISPNISKLSATLKKLSISRNNFSIMPDEIGYLTNLEELEAIYQKTKMTKISPKISQCKLLRSLNLSNNEVVEFPSQLMSLVNLISLDLSFNKIITLPEALQTYTSLKELNLENNSLKDIPPCIINMFSLDYLNLRENPIEASIIAAFKKTVFFINEVII